MVIVCDGGKRRDIAYGSYKILDDFDEICHHQMIFGDNTSNSAEYLSLYFALKKAVEIGVRDVKIISDSSLVVNQVLGNWRCNYPHLQLLRDKIRQELKDNFDSWTLDKVDRKIIMGYLGH